MAGRQHQGGAHHLLTKLVVVWNPVDRGHSRHQNTRASAKGVDAFSGRGRLFGGAGARRSSAPAYAVIRLTKVPWRQKQGRRSVRPHFHDNECGAAGGGEGKEEEGARQEEEEGKAGRHGHRAGVPQAGGEAGKRREGGGGGERGVADGGGRDRRGGSSKIGRLPTFCTSIWS